jgi:class 3 adenylate cyclase
MTGMGKSWALRAGGDPPGALDAIERVRLETANSNEKVRWRTNVELGEILLELGRLDEAASVIPAPSERAELQDLIYDAGPQIRLRLHTGRLDEAVQLAREIAANANRLAPYNDALGIAVEALVAAGLIDEAQAVVNAGRPLSAEVGGVLLDEAQGRILLAQGEPPEAAVILTAVAQEAGARGFRLVEWRARTLAGEALERAGRLAEAECELKAVAAEAGAAGAALIREGALAAGQRLGMTISEVMGPPNASTRGADPIPQAGERLITSMFADVRGYTALTAVTPPAEMIERMTTLYRWAAAEVSRHHGFVDKFAGDAVMATFNATGQRLHHARDALEAALALSGKAALLDLGLGIGISVGPAVVGPAAADGNISVLGSTTNLAARLQTAATAGEIVLSDEAHRRVAAWLAEHGLTALPDTLELKGFTGPQPAWRLHAAATRPRTDPPGQG